MRYKAPKLSVRRALSYLPVLVLLAGMGTCAYIVVSEDNSEKRLVYCRQVDQMLSLFTYATHEYTDLIAEIEQDYRAWENPVWRDSMSTNKAVIFGISDALMLLSEENTVAKALEEESVDFALSIVYFTASTEDILSNRPNSRLIAIGQTALTNMQFDYFVLSDAQIEYCH